MNAKRYELAVATVLLGGVALAGCSQQSAVSPATTGAIAPSSRVPTAPPPAPVTAPSSTATAPPPAPTSADVVPVASPADTPICTTAQLSASLVPDRGGASAGHFAVWLRVQNTSSRVCRIDGYGGVSLVDDNNGTQLGAPADRTPATVTPTILISGARAPSSRPSIGSWERNQVHLSCARNCAATTTSLLHHPQVTAASPAPTARYRPFPGYLSLIVPTTIPTGSHLLH